MAIPIFNFYPLTALIIVVLALLNDSATSLVAYDQVHYRDQPEAWDMPMVIGVATVLGVVGPIAAFGLFYLSDQIFHLPRPHIQTLMYLMPSVAGYLTIFQTCARGPFWSIRLAKIFMDSRTRYANYSSTDRSLWTARSSQFELVITVETEKQKTSCHSLTAPSIRIVRQPSRDLNSR